MVRRNYFIVLFLIFASQNLFSQKLTNKFLERNKWFSISPCNISDTTLLLFSQQSQFYTDNAGACQFYEWTFGKERIFKVDKNFVCQEPPPYWTILFKNSSYKIFTISDDNLILFHFKTEEDTSSFIYLIDRVEIIRDDNYIIHLSNKHKELLFDSNNKSGTREIK
jgi:hypothetical protein